MLAKAPRKRHVDRLAERIERAMLAAFGRYVANLRTAPEIAEAVTTNPRGLETIMARIRPYIREFAADRHRLLRHAVASEMAEQQRRIAKVRKQDEEDLDEAAVTQALISVGFDPGSPRPRA